MSRLCRLLSVLLVVVATGAHSEIGRISAMLAQVHTLTTPLMQQLASFARWLTGAILGLAVLAVLLLFNFSLSPWMLLGVRYFVVTPYLLIA